MQKVRWMNVFMCKDKIHMQYRGEYKSFSLKWLFVWDNKSVYTRLKKKKSLFCLVILDYKDYTHIHKCIKVTYRGREEITGEDW